MKQEVYDITAESIARPTMNIAKGIKKYKKYKGEWVENKECKRLKSLHNSNVKKVAEYEIQED